MKTTLILAVFTATLISAAAQNYQVRENGLNHRVWEASVEERDAGNRVVTRSVNYTELASGLMYEENGELKPSKAEIELFRNGAAARKGQHKVIFAPDASAEVTIDLEARDGKRFQSRVIGLAFYDRVSGQSALFAEIKPSVGELLPPNQILYPNAFTDIDADLLYTYTISGFEQFVILNERPPQPEEYGLNSATTQLEVWTEFLEPPVPVKRTRVHANGLADEALDFGEMRIGRGTAFYNTGGDSVVVGKAWQKISGRDFLIEAVLHNEVRRQLDLLPQRQAAQLKTPEALRAAVRKERTVPMRRLAGVNPGKIEVAQVVRPRHGFTIDYTTLSGSLGDYTFRGDTTYLIANVVSVDGTATIEGGAVLKYTNNANATVSFQGEVVFQTSEYLPAVLTCKDDNSIGETIAGSTGTPSGYYASRALEFIASTQPIQYLRISHATTAVALVEYDLPIQHCQFTFCKTGIGNTFATSTVRDVLMNRVETPFAGTNLTVRAEHLTVHECNKLTDLGSTNSTIYLTNSLLVHMTNWGTSLYVTNAVGVVNDSGVFQTVGAGKHYLASASPYRGVGTTNINADLAEELRRRTTYPPVMAGHLIILANTNLILSPQAGRDADIPDLGYHYSPIDFTFGGVYVTNSTITLNPGTVVVLYSPTNGGFSYNGIVLSDGAKIFSEGSPTNLNRIVRYNTVQEQTSTTWNTTPTSHIVSDPGDVVNTPEARFRFTEWSIPAADTEHFYGGYGTDLAAAFTDCQFFGGKFRSERPTVNVTNSLFHRTAVFLQGADYSLDATFRNTLFYGGSLYLYQEFGGTFTFKDNLFDRVAISQLVTPTHDYNGYITNAPLQWLTNSGTHNVFTNTFSYETGALGKFYQATNSIFLGKGSTTANLLGLYHYTVVTNNVKETNSVVDIGFHCVATDANGNPLDGDSDGTPDYMEDLNGNGSVDSGETDWQSAGDGGLRVLITRPRNGSILP